MFQFRITIQPVTSQRQLNFQRTENNNQQWDACFSYLWGDQVPCCIVGLYLSHLLRQGTDSAQFKDVFHVIPTALLLVNAA